MFRVILENLKNKIFFLYKFAIVSRVVFAVSEYDNMEIKYVLKNELFIIKDIYVQSYPREHQERDYFFI